MSTAVSFRSQANEAKCYAIEAQFEVVDATADAAPPSVTIAEGAEGVKVGDSLIGVSKEVGRR